MSWIGGFKLDVVSTVEFAKLRCSRRCWGNRVRVLPVGHSLGRHSLVSISTAVLGMALEFRVIWEINIESESPKEAAQEARVIQLTPGMSATIFDVWAHATGKMHRIDLIEQPDSLDRDERFAVRAGLRLLQCDANTPLNIQELATTILIFLDGDNMISKRVHRVPPV
jgi:hypothetical protein